jgi:uncharacterized protein (DUF952 family)
MTDPTLPTIAYKIETRSAWEAAMAAGVYGGSALDRADGFIHLSAAAQVRRTAELYFTGQPDLILATVDLAALGAAVVWEPSRAGDLFPHIYGPLPASAVIETVPLVPGADGVFVFAETIP